MSEALGTYLNDHIGGAQIALQLLEAMRDQHEDAKYRAFANALLPEIQSDDATLRSITERMEGRTSAIKSAGGWLLEKAARAKLGHTGSTDLDLFESLELLLLGVHGKECLWKALRTVATFDSRLGEYDFDGLVRRANAQYEIIESERLSLAMKVFS